MDKKSIKKFNNEYCQLYEINRTHITTDECAFYLNRKPQTLRIWAMNEKGPLKPIRINGRLAWEVNKIKEILIKDR